MMRKKRYWKLKFNHFLLSFNQELIKVGLIGKKLIKASRTNVYMKDSYEELGRLLEKGIESGEIECDSQKIRALLHTVKACKKDLEHIDKQVYKLKFSSGPKGPEDISRNHSESNPESSDVKK